MQYVAEADAVEAGAAGLTAASPAGYPAFVHVHLVLPPADLPNKRQGEKA